MTRKIFKGILAVSVFTLIFSFLLNMGVLYSYFDGQLQKELKSEAVYVGAGVEQQGGSYLDELKASDNRITWIDSDGTVLYDNQADAASMDNHRDREEVKQALEDGEGAASRYSKTIANRTIYYAKRLEDGTVLRISSEQSSILALLAGMIVPTLMIIAASAAVSGVLASRVSRNIINPLNDIDLNRPDEADVYEELNPLLHKISRQNDQIEQQVNNLKRKQKEFSVITENMQEGFLLIDRNTEVLSYNSSALRLLGITDMEENASVLALNRSESFRTAVEQALEGRHNEQSLKTGTACYDIIANPVLLQGEITGVVVVILDVTEKEMRDQLRREFTSNVSHELKTPLTSIYGVADMLSAGLVKPEDVPSFAGDIFKECRRMIHLIDDIMRLSQLEEDSLPAKREPVEMLALAKSVKKSLDMICTEKKVHMEVDGEQTFVNGISTMLEEILYNLSENAVKYNHPGGMVHVHVAREQDTAVITVEDDGIGIAPEHTERIFERFYRVDKSHSRKIGGTGLGLSIVKHGVQYHGGTIQVESQEGKGTKMIVRLPAV